MCRFRDFATFGFTCGYGAASSPPYASRRIGLSVLDFLPASPSDLLVLTVKFRRQVLAYDYAPTKRVWSHGFSTSIGAPRRLPRFVHLCTGLSSARATSDLLVLTIKVRKRVWCHGVLRVICARAASFKFYVFVYRLCILIYSHEDKDHGDFSLSAYP